MNDRLTSLLFLAALLALLAIAGIFAKAANERDMLQQELVRLQEENANLESQVEELKQKDELQGRIEDWLEAWEIDEAEATFYTKECGTGDGITYTGTKATVGRTVAVDPLFIPLGSWLYIEGFGWRRAEDTGSAVQGNIIDIYVGEGAGARKEALRLGRQKVRVVYQKEAKGLAERKINTF
ncbi:MAG: 3D domain-containing protein [Dehalococcoidales bacterium]|nr:3D domain-containing protein [Dehalococcoidales bacterium]